MSRRIIGQYVIADPAICHGKLTFRGTRIMVSQVLEMVAEGKDWDSITAAWGGKIKKEAIGEAVSIASQVFSEHIHEYTVEPVSA